MNIDPFKLERYFAQYEFSVKYLLSSSDCDGLFQNDLLAMADTDARKLWDDLQLGYTESQGHSLLRKEIANLYQGISPEEVLVVAPEEGIFIAMNTLLAPSDHVIATFPGYQSLYAIAESIGAEITKWLPNEQDDWRFDPEFLESRIQPNTKLLVFNFPHNPTGYLPSHDDFRRMLDIARKRDLVIFSDEMYRFLEYDAKDRLPSASERYDRAISLFGMSKTFGLAGLRLGWLVVKDRSLLEKMLAMKDYTTICSSAPSEILAIIALRNKEKIIEANLAKIQKNLASLDVFFAEHAHRFSWMRPKAGTIGFPKLHSGESSDDFCQRVVRDADIMLLPSRVYDYDDAHFRLGFGRANMPESLDAFASYLDWAN